MPQRRSQPELAEIVALARALDREDQQSPAELLARDRRLASTLPAATDDRVAVGLAWLDAVESEDQAVRTVHQRAETALHLTGFFIVLAGIVLGWGATLGAFYFDGSGRVNAVSVLALLVALPGLFILPFLIAALPPSVAERVPGVRLITALSSAFSPGRLAPLVWRLFPSDLREPMALLSGRMGKHHRLYGDLQRWAVLRWSQHFAVAFQLTALVACLVLVVFTDLAFGWSTTLTTGDASRDAQRVHRLTTVIATPWAWVIEEAQPSLQLIEESRYFRVTAEPVSSAQAARLGEWWKFVVLTIAVYGLLPRILTVTLAHFQLRAAARAAMLEAPGLSAVLRRLHRSQIETVALVPESADSRTWVPGADNGALKEMLGSVSAVVNWAGVPLETAVLVAQLPKAKFFHAGGTSPLADDLALVRKIGAETRDDGASVLIVVKSWEPPLMEFMDFVTTLRAALPAKSSLIQVLPVGLEGSRSSPSLEQASASSATAVLPAATSAQLKLWRDRLHTLGDPWLRVAQNLGEICG
jgi:hypothetical protein